MFGQESDDNQTITVMEHVKRLWCGLTGHDTMMHFEKDRMSLVCGSCGHESPGWDLKEAPPTITNDVPVSFSQPRFVSAARRVIG
jgi:hypothetical protein